MDNISVRVTANFRPNAMNYKHNIRNKEICRKEKNVDLSHYHENIVDMGDVNNFFNKLFEESVKEYNSRQKRSDRRIKNNDYLTFIKSKKFKSNHKALESDGKIKPVTEIELKIGNRDNQWPNRKQLYKILKAFVKKFEQLYGNNVKIVGAYLHDDEYSISKDKKKNKIFNPPHVHLDVVYVAHSLTEEEIKIEDEDRKRIRLEKMEEYKKEGKKWNEDLWKKTDWTEYRVNKFGKSLRNGLRETCSMSAALAELGFRTCPKKQTAQIQFQHDVHKQFQDFCEEMGLNIDRTKVESHKHVSPEVLAQINENKKLEKELKKQELKNRHDRKIIEKKQDALDVERLKLKEKELAVNKKQSFLIEKTKELKNKEAIISDSETKLTEREISISKREDNFKTCESVLMHFQNTINPVRDELSLVNDIENKTKRYYEETQNPYASISFFSKGIKKIVSNIKYELIKYKNAFKDFFSFTPRRFRLLADSMERNKCNTYKEYHDKQELGHLNFQLRQKEENNNKTQMKFSR